MTCEGLGFPVSGLGRYPGFVLGPDSHPARWVAVRTQFLAGASHVTALGLHSLGILLAYNMFAVSVVSYTSELKPLRRPCRIRRGRTSR